MGQFLDGEWESICKLFSVEESPDLSANFLEYYAPSSLSNNEKSCNFPETIAHTHSNISDNNTEAANFFTDILSCIDFANMSGENDTSLDLSFPHNTRNESSMFKRMREEEANSFDTSNKNARISNVASKGKTKAPSKIDEDVTRDENYIEINETLDTNSDNSNASEEINETEDSNSNTTVSLTSTGKKRASRGAATDPQSLYARKRRMKINERLKILQSLVPNGTKVDISTMLEEAFNYVKFLQHQIRMLSSDDLWMYAPLAYNGLDIGAYRKMPPFLGL